MLRVARPAVTFAETRFSEGKSMPLDRSRNRSMSGISGRRIQPLKDGALAARELQIEPGSILLPE